MLRDFEDPDLHEVVVFVSTATSASEIPISRLKYSSPVYIVCVDNTQAQGELARMLRDKISNDDFGSCSIIDYHNALNIDLNGGSVRCSTRSRPGGFINGQ